MTGDLIVGLKLWDEIGKKSHRNLYLLVFLQELERLFPLLT